MVIDVKEVVQHHDPLPFIFLAARTLADEHPRQTSLLQIHDQIRQDMLLKNPHATEAMLAPTLLTASILDAMRQQHMIARYIPTPFSSFLDTQKVDFIIVTTNNELVLLQTTSNRSHGTEHRHLVQKSPLAAYIFILQTVQTPSTHEGHPRASRHVIDINEGIRRIQTGIDLTQHILLEE